MQVGIDSFATAFDDSSLAVSSQDRLRHLVEQIEHADQAGLDVFGVGEHHRREYRETSRQHGYATDRLKVGVHAPGYDAGTSECPGAGALNAADSEARFRESWRDDPLVGFPL